MDPLKSPKVTEERKKYIEEQLNNEKIRQKKKLLEDPSYVKTIRQQVEARLQKIDQIYRDDNKNYQTVSISYTKRRKICIATNMAHYAYEPSKYTTNGTFVECLNGYGFPKNDIVLNALKRIDSDLIENREVVLVKQKLKLNIKDNVKRKSTKSSRKEVRKVMTKETDKIYKAHAEMQLLKYSIDTLDPILSMGTSKENCRKCEKELKKKMVPSDGQKHDGKEKNMQPKNWEKPEKIDVDGSILQSKTKSIDDLFIRGGFEGPSGDDDADHVKEADDDGNNGNEIRNAGNVEEAGDDDERQIQSTCSADSEDDGDEDGCDVGFSALFHKQMNQQNNPL